MYKIVTPTYKTIKHLNFLLDLDQELENQRGLSRLTGPACKPTAVMSLLDTSESDSVGIFAEMDFSNMKRPS
jgi:hypothetical protein